MKIPYEQIAAYLSGKARAQEKAEVEKWVNSNDEHRRIYQSLEREWKFLNKGSLPLLPDKEQIWKEIRNRIELPVTAVLYSKKNTAKVYQSNCICRPALRLVSLIFVYRRKVTIRTIYGPYSDG